MLGIEEQWLVIWTESTVSETASSDFICTKLTLVVHGARQHPSRRDARPIGNRQVLVERKLVVPTHIQHLSARSRS